MTRFATIARAGALGLLGLAMLGAAPAGAVALPAWLTPVGIALNLREWLQDSLPVEAPERRFLAEGRAALGEGDVARAARAYEAALAANPDSIEALTFLGLIREEQGRADLAVPLYRHALDMAALRHAAEIVQPSPPPPPDDAAEGEAPPPPSGPTWRVLAEVAGERLAAMAPAPAAPVDPRQSLIDRLAVLDALLAEGYIDVDEHRARRAANIGALLVRTAPPPGAVLAAAAPAAEDVLDRFDQVERQHKRGVLSDAQWAAERATMLDALLPLEGARLAGLPPVDDAILASLGFQGILTADEVGAERRSAGTASVAALAPVPPAPAPMPPLPAEKPAVAAVAAAASPDEPAEAAEPAEAEPETAEKAADAEPPITPSAPPAVTPEADTPAMIGIHLASYRTPEQARQGWTDLQAANADLLGGLSAHIAAVDRGDRGVYFEVSAGPLDSNATALQTCAALVARGLFCATTLY